MHRKLFILLGPYLILPLILLFAGQVFATTIQKVILENDLVAVNASGSNVPARYKRILDAFGQTSEECTATHIGRGYVVTAGHCFWAPPKMVEHTGCSNTKIKWGLRGGKDAYLISKCQEIVAAQRSEFGDFAVLKVSPVPDTFVLPDLSRSAIIGDSLTVFSHPDKLPLHWSRHCGVERIQDEMLPLGMIHHRCDTNPGSSGATLINLVTLKVVGIHGGGYTEAGAGMNYATFIMQSPLYEVLKRLGF